MQTQLKHGLPAKFSAYSGAIIGERLEVGTGRQYANLAAVMAYIATKTWASSTAFGGTVTSTASSSAITGTGLSSVPPDSYLQVGANYWAVKSITNDTNAVLWHGAQASVAGSAATLRTLSQFTVVLYNNQTISNATFPDGVSVLIVGATENIRLISNGTLTIAIFFRLEVAYLTIVTDSSFIFFGALGSGRGIVSIHDVTLAGKEAGGVLLFGAMAAFTMQRCNGASFRVSVQTDYLFVDNGHNNSIDVNDVFLASYVLATDNGHPYTFNNLRVINLANSTTGQSSGVEINAIPATKQVNITNSMLVSYGAIAGAYPMWLSGSGGVYTFTNSIIDAVNSTFEVYDRRLGVGSVNYIATTRMNGAALRVTT